MRKRIHQTDEKQCGPYQKQGSYTQVCVKIQGLLKASPTVFKDLKLMKSTDLSVKILLQKC